MHFELRATKLIGIGFPRRGARHCSFARAIRPTVAMPVAPSAASAAVLFGTPFAWRGGRLHHPRLLGGLLRRPLLLLRALLLRRPLLLRTLLRTLIGPALAALLRPALLGPALVSTTVPPMVAALVAPFTAVPVLGAALALGLIAPRLARRAHGGIVRGRNGRGRFRPV